MKKLALSGGHHCIVDDDDYEFLNQKKARELHGEFARLNFPATPAEGS